MTDAPETEGSLAAEFQNLGKNLKDALRAAWEGEDRKKLHQEIETGLMALGKALNEAATEFSESPTGQRLKAESEELRERLRSGEIASRTRDELLALLRRINAELEKAAAPTAAGGETSPADVRSGQS